MVQMKNTLVKYMDYEGREANSTDEKLLGRSMQSMVIQGLGGCGSD